MDPPEILSTSEMNFLSISPQIVPVDGLTSAITSVTAGSLEAASFTGTSAASEAAAVVSAPAAVVSAALVVSAPAAVVSAAFVVSAAAVVAAAVVAVVDDPHAAREAASIAAQITELTNLFFITHFLHEIGSVNPDLYLISFYRRGCAVKIVNFVDG